MTSKRTSVENGGDKPFWVGNPDAQAFADIQKQRLALAREALKRLLSVIGERTVGNTLKPYDEILTYLDSANSQSSLMEQVHPDATLRATSEKLTQEVSSFASELSLNRSVYDALRSIRADGLDEVTAHYLSKTLREFQLAGVDKDEATRGRIKALRDELVAIGQEFSRNIREDKRTVTARSVDELQGLPADFIARHKPNPDGTITLSIEHPDAIPVLTYAKSDTLRREMYFAFNTRAYPGNIAVLDTLISRRHTLATLLGFQNWADYVTADKMAGTGRNVSDFIEKIAEASRSKGLVDYQRLLDEKRKDDPDAQSVVAWESGYWSERVRKSDFEFDAQSVRPYFPY
ncbi:MAG TPA: M3 family metallopeptidase, partial [Bacteroidota bacterium]|nr:M3 family metallopeptidase [Bacteroidota bacterium]